MQRLNDNNHRLQANDRLITEGNYVLSKGTMGSKDTRYWRP